MNDIIHPSLIIGLLLWIEYEFAPIRGILFLGFLSVVSVFYFLGGLWVCYLFCEMVCFLVYRALVDAAPFALLNTMVPLTIMYLE